jgi:hypothetical protein
LVKKPVEPEWVDYTAAERFSSLSHTTLWRHISNGNIKSWRLPTRPTKVTDTRASKFRQVHGTESVELDAIPPDALRVLVKAAIERHRDPWELRQLRTAEQNEREALKSVFKDTSSRPGGGGG